MGLNDIINLEEIRKFKKKDWIPFCIGAVIRDRRLKRELKKEGVNINYILPSSDLYPKGKLLNRVLFDGYHFMTTFYGVLTPFWYYWYTS